MKYIPHPAKNTARNANPIIRYVEVSHDGNTINKKITRVEDAIIGYHTYF